MHKIFICLTVLFLSTTSLFADRAKINDKGIVDVEFESIKVGAGSFDSQIFIIGNIGGSDGYPHPTPVCLRTASSAKNFKCTRKRYYSDANLKVKYSK